MRGSCPDPLQGNSRSPSVGLFADRTPGPSQTHTPIPTVPVLPLVNDSRPDSDLDEEEALDDEYDDLAGEEERRSYGATEDLVPIFDDAHGEEALITEEAPMPQWDNGEHVTPEERVILLAMDSDKERAHAMNMRLRDRESVDQGLLTHVLPILPKHKPGAEKKQQRAKEPSKKTKAKGKTTAEGETEDSSSGKKPRRSARKLPTTSGSRSASDTAQDESLTTTFTSASTTLSPLSTAISAGLNDGSLPDWIEEAMSYLDQMCAGPTWTSIIVKWVDLETRLKFPKGRVSNCFPV